MKLWLDIWFNKKFDKINQIEIGEEYAYISVSYKDKRIYTPKCFIGVDRNTSNHVLVASNLKSGKVLKMGKSCNHIHEKYSNIRRKLQKKAKFKRLKKMKHREKNIIKNINQKISKKLVDEAYNLKGGLVLENLERIRKVRINRTQRYSLTSWSFYQLGQMIEYKSKKLGVPIFYVEPQYTSQRCSKCGHIEKTNRKRNLFHCKKCGKVEDSGVNAGFNLAVMQSKGILQFNKDRDLLKGNTNNPKEALLKSK